MTVAPGRKRRFDWPHYHPPGVEIERYEAHGYPQATVVAACGREVAATLVTRSPERTRCHDCIAAVEGEGAEVAPASARWQRRGSGPQN